MEAFKLFAAAILSPLLIALIIQAIGWILWWRNSRYGVRLIALGTMLLTFGSLSGFTYEKRREQEFVYHPLDIANDLPQEQPVLVIVLGTGFNPDPQLPANSQVSGAFLSRLLEGVRIFRSRCDANMLVSIAGKADSTEKQQFLDRMIELLQLDPARVTLVSTAKSTSDEAEETARQHHNEQVIVVTSAGHMPRAIQIFRDANLAPLAAPTDYGFPRAGSPGDKIWPRWIPSAEGIGSNHQWLYEQAASIWHTISGK